MAQEEPVTPVVQALACQHCYAKISQTRGQVVWRDSSGFYTCDPGGPGEVRHQPMPQI